MTGEPSATAGGVAITADGGRFGGAGRSRAKFAVNVAPGNADTVTEAGRWASSMSGTTLTSHATGVPSSLVGTPSMRYVPSAPVRTPPPKPVPTNTLASGEPEARSVTVPTSTAGAAGSEPKPTSMRAPQNTLTVRVWLTNPVAEAVSLSAHGVLFARMWMLVMVNRPSAPVVAETLSPLTLAPLIGGLGLGVEHEAADLRRGALLQHRQVRRRRRPVGGLHGDLPLPVAGQRGADRRQQRRVALAERDPADAEAPLVVTEHLRLRADVDLRPGQRRTGDLVVDHAGDGAGAPRRDRLVQRRRLVLLDRRPMPSRSSTRSW